MKQLDKISRQSKNKLIAAQSLAREVKYLNVTPKHKKLEPSQANTFFDRRLATISAGSDENQDG